MTRSKINPVKNALIMLMKLKSTSFDDKTRKVIRIKKDKKTYKLKILNKVENLPLKIF